MYDELEWDDRLRLLRFACSFAWADLRVGEGERAWLEGLIDALELDEESREQAEAWLEHPPGEEALDPAEIPEAQRQLFLDVLGRMVVADGSVDPMELESYALLAQLLGEGENE